MKKSLALSIVALVSQLGGPVLAQHAHGTTAPAVQKTQVELTDGEVRRLDAAKGTILIKHAEIKSINMGAMTMNFKLKEPGLATGLKAGDKVRFAVEAQGDQLIVTRIEKAR